MENLPLMAEIQPPQQLEHEYLDIVGVQGTRVLFHVVTEVCVLSAGGEGQGREGGRKGGRGREREGR